MLDDNVTYCDTCAGINSVEVVNRGTSSYWGKEKQNVNNINQVGIKWEQHDNSGGVFASCACKTTPPRVWMITFCRGDVPFLSRHTETHVHPKLKSNTAYIGGTHDCMFNLTLSICVLYRV
jgi:hypothetical protein